MFGIHKTSREIGFLGTTHSERSCREAPPLSIESITEVCSMKMHILIYGILVISILGVADLQRFRLFSHSYLRQHTKLSQSLLGFLSYPPDPRIFPKYSLTPRSADNDY
jgi:hypothetical protein